MRGKALLVGFATILMSFGVFAEPWDIFRPVTTVADVLDPITAWIVFLLALGVFAIAVLAVKKKRSPKLMWVTAAFGFFALKRLLNLVDLYFSPGDFMNVAVSAVFDFLIIVCLFVAIFRK